MFSRVLEKTFLQALASFPAVVLTGARQTGKTTLCRQLLKDSHRYASLEDPDIRRFALEDPRGFLETYPAPVILDEIQYAPELPSYLQRLIDEKRQVYGQYVLTGSQNFLLMQQVSQSLAGRAAVLSLYPLSCSEVYRLDELATRSYLTSYEGIADWILRGSYPELRARKELDRKLWCSSYVRLYLERDVRKILNVDDLDSFERFLRLCAARTGQILNLNDLARDAGISPPTAKRWMAVLEASYQIFLLKPFYRNIGKRFIKSPKLYFTDTALASYLMGLHEPEALIHSPQFGALFETAVIMNRVKVASISDEVSLMHFIATQGDFEIDLFLHKVPVSMACEIKAGKTPSLEWGRALSKTEKFIDGPLKKYVLSLSNEEIHHSSGLHFLPWFEVERLS